MSDASAVLLTEHAESPGARIYVTAHLRSGGSRVLKFIAEVVGVEPAQGAWSRMRLRFDTSNHETSDEMILLGREVHLKSKDIPLPVGGLVDLGPELPPLQPPSPAPEVHPAVAQGVDGLPAPGDASEAFELTMPGAPAGQQAKPGWLNARQLAQKGAAAGSSDPKQPLPASARKGNHGLEEATGLAKLAGKELPLGKIFAIGGGAIGLIAGLYFFTRLVGQLLHKLFG